ncbi:MAG TPA: putative Ig domain-containing protein [Candidatus Acidoferrales bacterium]|nr:putative Ig domain-containing protein [Candidatus Acidoferrales bacterium]
MKRDRILLTGLAFVLLTAALLSGCGGSGASSFIIVITPGANQFVDQNQSVAFTAFVANDKSDAGVTWSLSGTHCAGAACGTLANNTTSSVTYVAPKSVGTLLNVTLTATAKANTKTTATLNISVSPAPTISTTSLPGAINGQNYSQQIVANGGVAPLFFSLTSGSLPAGFHLDTNGLISGRSSSNGGTFNFTVLVTDQGNPPLTASQSYTIIIAPAPPLAILSTSLTNAAQGSIYNFPLAASGGVPPLTWAITAGALPPGLALNATTGQISGTPTTQGTFGFTVKVTDSALVPPNQQPQTATQALSLTVGVPGSLAIATTSLPQANTATLYSQQLRVTGGVGPFAWKVTGGILPSGLTLSASGVISGVPTAVSTNTFTVQVTDAEPTPQTAAATLSISIVSSVNNNALLNGNYVFVFSGFNSSGPVVLGGTLLASGTGGIFGSEDSNNNNPAGSTQNNGPGPVQNTTVAGSYSIGSDGRGSFTLNSAAIVSTYQFALDANGDAQFIEADSTGTHGTGILRKQGVPNFTAQSFSGNYAFELAGTDPSGKRDALAGVFNADGTSLFKNGNIDTNFAGALGTNLSGVTGTFLLAQNGRGAASLTLPTPVTLNLVFYMVTPSDALFIGIDPISKTNPMTVGEARLQSQSSFDKTSLSGPSVATATGLGPSGNASVLAGLLMADGNTGISSTLDTNDAGTITSNAGASGSYSVASNGRATTSGLSNQLAVLYLIGPNQAFLIGQDSAASTGIVEPQVGGPFNSASLSSYFTFGPSLSASLLTSDKTSNDFAGSILSDGAGNISGKLDEAGGSGIPSSNLALKATYTIGANGRGAISASSPPLLAPQFVFYMVSPAQVRAISSTAADTHPQVFFFDH